MKDTKEKDTQQTAQLLLEHKEQNHHQTIYSITSSIHLFVHVPKQTTMHSIKHTLFVASALSQLITTTHAFSQVVSICQNKDCIKKFQSSSKTNHDGGIIQLMTDLIPPPSHDKNDADQIVTIESTGCLSHCGCGPNVCIKNKSTNKERVFNDVKDIQMAAAVLEVGGGIDCPIELMVAVDMIGQASRSKYSFFVSNIYIQYIPNNSSDVMFLLLSFSSYHNIKATSLTKKIDVLSQVIESLQCPLYSSSNALSHAYVMRADAYIETQQQQNLQDQTNDTLLIQKALEDVSKAIPINHLHGRAYRVQADAYEALGDILHAMESVENWAKVNPAFMSKAKNELSRLLSVKKM